MAGGRAWPIEVATIRRLHFQGYSAQKIAQTVGRSDDFVLYWLNKSKCPHPPEPIIREYERWRHVPGYNGRYMVSSLGRVRGRTYRDTRPLLKPAKNSFGYLHVNLCKNRKRKSFLVHRLVALVFLRQPCFRKNKVHHIDGIKTNNRVNNLRYVTQKQNVAEAIRMGLFPSNSGESHPGHKLTWDDVHKIRILSKNGVRIKTLVAAFGVSSSGIAHVVSGKNWKEVPGGDKRIASMGRPGHGR